MMTEQEKQLLLVTLCSMLPYGVVVKATYKDGEGWKTNDRKLLGVYQHDGQVYLDGVYTDIDKVKPYLRPMSSMTEEEEVIYEQLIKDVHYKPRESTCCKLISWLNENYFDHNYLIEKELAIAVTDDNNPYKE